MLLWFSKIDLKVVPYVCLEQAEDGLGEYNLSSVDTLRRQQQILQVVKREWCERWPRFTNI